MSALLKLPAELLADILGRLSKTDQKAVRRTSRGCETLTTPLVFGEVPFDLEPGGCEGLASIATTVQLQRHVHTVRLSRRNGLRCFGSFEGWLDANIYEHVPDTELFGEAPPFAPIPWAALGDDARRIMYEEYQRDSGRLDEYFARLASAIFTWTARRYGTSIEATIQASDAWRILHRYDTASRALRGVHTFAYVPAYRMDEDNWGGVWRNIGFHEFALMECGWANDPLYDTVELFAALALRTAATIPLRSLTLGTQGPAFRSTQRLCQLLHSMQNLIDDRWRDYRDDDGPELWLTDIGGPLPAIGHVAYLTRALVAIERGFTQLTCLQCRIDTLQADRQGEVESIAAGVSSSLAEATMLERLVLAFRDDALSDEEGEAENFSLNRVQLSVLEDVIDGRPRLILDSRAPVWRPSSIPGGWYHEYEDSIAQYALGKSKKLPMLCQDKYVEKRSLAALTTEISKGGIYNV